MIRVANLDEILADTDTYGAVLRLWEAMFGNWTSDRSLDELSDAQRKFYAVYDLETEINNGGFHQYFSNSAGDQSKTCLIALAEMEATAARALLVEALTIFPENFPVEDRNARNEQLDELDDEAFDRLSPLDERWYSEVRDLSSKLMNFVKKNRDQF